MGVKASSHRSETEPSLSSLLIEQASNRYPPMPQPLVKEFGFGNGRGEFRYAKGVAATCEEPSMIYVTDIGKHCIQVFNEDMEFQFQFDNKMHSPVYVHVSARHVFVANYFTSSVTVYTCEGHFITYIGNSGKEKGAFQVPSGMFCDMPRNELYICDTNNQRVQIFSDQRIDLLRNGEDSRPYDVKGALNEIFVLDGSEITIEVYNLCGEHLRTIHFDDKRKLKTSYYLAVDRVGNIFIAILPNCIIILNKEGDLIQKIVQARDEHFVTNNLTNGLTLDGTGRLVLVAANGVNMVMSIY